MPFIGGQHDLQILAINDAVIEFVLLNSGWSLYGGTVIDMLLIDIDAGLFTVPSPATVQELFEFDHKSLLLTTQPDVYEHRKATLNEAWQWPE